MTECKGLLSGISRKKNPALSGIFVIRLGLILDQEVIQLFTLLIHCFLDNSWSTTLAGPGFLFAVLINVAIFSRTSSAFCFGTGFRRYGCCSEF
ncbi:MAG: hypothetical protein K0S17_4019 [Enterobacter mori]|nr:hypothetical protein [Enterobacter mori]